VLPFVNRELGTVTETRIGRGITETARRFVVDFGGEALQGRDPAPEAKLFASRGALSSASTHFVPDSNVWRTQFELIPEGYDPIELRCHLEAGGQALTETWCYQWTE
jgi:glucans biosynthesis protein